MQTKAKNARGNAAEKRQYCNLGKSDVENIYAIMSGGEKKPAGITSHMSRIGDTLGCATLRRSLRGIEDGVDLETLVDVKQSRRKRETPQPRQTTF